MHLLDGRPVYSASDLVGFLHCEHLTDLERAALAGLVRRPERDDAELDLLRRRGEAHERRYLAELEAVERTVTVIAPDAAADAPEGSRESTGDRLRRQVDETRGAMERGDDVVYQAALFDGRWRGHADFLLRVDGADAASALGEWHYEIADTKLAHETKAGALIQLCLYADLLAGIQGRRSESVHVALGGSERRVEAYRVADYFAYYQALKSRFEQAVAPAAEGGRPVAHPHPLSAPDPVDHCAVCRWFLVCRARWRTEDHLSLVAGISRNQRRALIERDVATRRRLAVLPLPVVPPLPRTSPASVARVREQARIQVAGEAAGATLYELLEPERLEDGSLLPGKGLAALPPPSAGDLFFDIEGDPFAFDDGLEYLFGVAEPGGVGRGDQPGDALPPYHHWWALDPAQEKAAFEAFIDFVGERRRRDPDLHVYHYGSYERGRVARLSTRYATREEQVDVLLRGSVFVDLLAVVRRAIRASVEAYSIKNLEPLYGFERDVELRTANESIVEFERYLETGSTDATTLELIREYNRDDCLSAWRLRDWLEARRPEAEANFGVSLPRPVATGGEAKADSSAARAQVRELAERLASDVPRDPVQRSPEQAARQLLADLLDWHWREEKSSWWLFFDLLARADDELLQAREPVAGLVFERSIPLTGKQRNPIYRYRFPPQETEVDVGDDVADPRLAGRDGFGWAGTVAAIDTVGGWLDLRRKPDHPPDHPTALVPRKSFRTDAQREALLEIGAWVADYGVAGPGPYRAARDLLLRAVPRAGQAPGDALARADETGAQAARRLVLSLDATALPIQGPPGSGKSTSGAQMILSLVESGRKVGITANSHKVIGNLLGKVIEQARAGGHIPQAVQKVSEDGQEHSSDHVTVEKGSNARVRRALDEGAAAIAAGTPWLWADDDMRDAVDVLFVDEAGQLSLANALAVSVGARSLILLGDPQQLDQPTQGSHPDGAGASALEHVLGGAPTIDPARGLFLEHTWRLHPRICEFTSELFYAGMLVARDGLERQALAPPFGGAGLFGGAGPPPALLGSGLRFVPVSHVGRSARSEEEAVVVADLLGLLLGAEWTDATGRRRTIDWTDLLVIAPYNAQVRAIRDLLPEAGKRRVGTVDKFQGQEAAVAIYSMTTSSPEEAPHGMEFLYSLNRLNVATSRARALAVLVASPELARVRCRTPRQVRLANALCRFLELAQEVSLA